MLTAGGLGMTLGLPCPGMAVSMIFPSLKTSPFQWKCDSRSRSHFGIERQLTMGDSRRLPDGVRPIGFRAMADHEGRCAVSFRREGTQIVEPTGPRSVHRAFSKTAQQPWPRPV